MSIVEPRFGVRWKGNALLQKALDDAIEEQGGVGQATPERTFNLMMNDPHAKALASKEKDPLTQRSVQLKILEKIRELRQKDEQSYDESDSDSDSDSEDYERPLAKPTGRKTAKSTRGGVYRYASNSCPESRSDAAWRNEAVKPRELTDEERAEAAEARSRAAAAALARFSNAPPRALPATPAYRPDRVTTVYDWNN